MDKMAIRAKLLAQLIEDMAMKDAGGEEKSPARTSKPEIEVLDVESDEKRDEETESEFVPDMDGDVDAMDELAEDEQLEKASPGPTLEEEPEEEDPEALNEEGLTPAEALAKKLKEQKGK